MFSRLLLIYASRVFGGFSVELNLHLGQIRARLHWTERGLSVTAAIRDCHRPVVISQADLRAQSGFLSWAASTLAGVNASFHFLAPLQIPYPESPCRDAHVVLAHEMHQFTKRVVCEEGSTTMIQRVTSWSSLTSSSGGSDMSGGRSQGGAT